MRESAAQPKWRRMKESRPRDIAAAALEIFGEKGFAGARIDEIAARAGVSKGTLYLYFETKADIFRAVVRAEGSRIVLDPELKKVLIGEMSEDDVAPRAAAAWLAHSLVEEGGGAIQVADNEEGILIIGTSLPA